MGGSMEGRACCRVMHSMACCLSPACISSCTEQQIHCCLPPTNTAAHLPSCARRAGRPPGRRRPAGGSAAPPTAAPPGRPYPAPAGCAARARTAATAAAWPPPPPRMPPAAGRAMQLTWEERAGSGRTSSSRHAKRRSNGRQTCPCSPWTAHPQRLSQRVFQLLGQRSCLLPAVLILPALAAGGGLQRGGHWGQRGLQACHPRPQGCHSCRQQLGRHQGGQAVRRDAIHRPSQLAGQAGGGRAAGGGGEGGAAGVRKGQPRRGGGSHGWWRRGV